MASCGLSAVNFRTVLLLLCWGGIFQQVGAMKLEEKLQLRNKSLEMFDHAYGSYMTHAYPADELMPLSCKGRYRNSEPSRGDIDEALGNFSLTLIDTLDTLAILGRYSEFERAIGLVESDVQFDADVVVSVFETNIRVLGGLLGGHVMAEELQRQGKCCQSYSGGLLEKAKEIGLRLLPAFNTSTGMPHPKINLRHGIANMRSKDTCTACAGTMLLEFAALSRLTGIPDFEEKAHGAMDYLWQQRNRVSDLMGTVIDIHNGAWVRKEAGIGAGIDSYYEYVLKAYVLLGEETYLHRFNKHYDSIMKYMSRGPMMVNVDMHRPTSGGVRGFMDALLAFWPGLQVLKGDIEPAVRMHEMLYQVTKRHNFLPEAFTNQFLVHWGQHPLRPEFVESTYFLYQATGDPYYLEVGKSILENLETHARVECGYAAIKDVRAKAHEDRLDSYVLAETFKYLYLLFAEDSDLPVDLHRYVFTTEAHLLPLSLAGLGSAWSVERNSTAQSVPVLQYEADDEDEGPPQHDSVCPNHNQPAHFPPTERHSYTTNLREPVKAFVDKTCPTGVLSAVPRLKPSEFIAGDPLHLSVLKSMGIQLQTISGGKVQLVHTRAMASNSQLADEGVAFMQEMLSLAQSSTTTTAVTPVVPRVVQLLATTPSVNQKSEEATANGNEAGEELTNCKGEETSVDNESDQSAKADSTANEKEEERVEPTLLSGESVLYQAGAAQFGLDLGAHRGVEGGVIPAVPLQACTKLRNFPDTVSGKILLAHRGGCMFVEKARHAQSSGAIGLIVMDNVEGTSSVDSPAFQMSGDGNDDVHIPVVFLFQVEGLALVKHLESDWNRHVYIGSTPKEKYVASREGTVDENGDFVEEQEASDPYVDEKKYSSSSIGGDREQCSSSSTLVSPSESSESKGCGAGQKGVSTKGVPLGGLSHVEVTIKIVRIDDVCVLFLSTPKVSFLITFPTSPAGLSSGITDPMNGVRVSHDQSGQLQAEIDLDAVLVPGVNNLPERDMFSILVQGLLKNKLSTLRDEDSSAEWMPSCLEAIRKLFLITWGEIPKDSFTVEDEAELVALVKQLQPVTGVVEADSELEESHTGEEWRGPTGPPADSLPDIHHEWVKSGPVRSDSSHADDYEGETFDELVGGAKGVLCKPVGLTGDIECKNVGRGHRENEETSAKDQPDSSSRRLGDDEERGNG